MTQSTYSIVASDGQTYGPSTREEIQGWINEGRLARETQMSRSDSATWSPAGDYQEFTWPNSAPATPVSDESARTTRGRGLTLADMDPNRVAEMRAHGSWFWWIAGMELVFGLMALFGGEGAPPGAVVRLIIFGPALLAVGVFAHRGKQWAFIIGAVLVALRLLDAALAAAWFATAIRAWALFEVFKGFQIARDLQKRMRGD
jgi:hypothetical protein